VICSTGQSVGATRPEKTDVLCEEKSGFGTAKAVIASRAVTVHVSTLSASSQELVARALPMSQPFPYVPRSVFIEDSRGVVAPREITRI
jgi:hypothetical protein